MFSEVSVATDFHAQALRGIPVAADLASQLGVPLSVLSVVPGDDLVAARTQDLRAALVQQGVDARLDVVPDVSPGNRIAETVRASPDRLLCMASHVRGPAAEALLGSVASRAIAGSRRPVMLIGPQCAERFASGFRRVMVCVDGSDLSERVLPAALGLARQLGAVLQLTQVVPPGLGPSAGRAVEAVAERLRAESGLAVDVRQLIGGDAGAVLIKALDEDRQTLPCMASHGRSGLERVLLGSVARHVARYAPVPVVLESVPDPANDAGLPPGVHVVG